MSIIENQIWQLIGAGLAFMTIATTIIIYFFQRKKKNLSYMIMSSVPLLNIKEEVKEKITILYGKEEINDLQLVIIKIINTGNVPIIPSDYEKPIEIRFGKTASIISAEVTETEPAALEIPNINLDSVLTLEPPVLLNQKDSATIKLLVSDFEKIDVRGRIVGVKKISQYSKERAIGFRVISFMTVWTAIIIAAMLSPDQYRTTYGIILVFTLFFFIALINSEEILQAFKKLKKKND